MIWLLFFYSFFFILFLFLFLPVYLYRTPNGYLPTFFFSRLTCIICTLSSSRRSLSDEGPFRFPNPPTLHRSAYVRRLDGLINLISGFMYEYIEQYREMAVAKIGRTTFSDKFCNRSEKNSGRREEMENKNKRRKKIITTTRWKNKPVGDEQCIVRCM